MSIHEYPFDPTGKAVTNSIKDEKQMIFSPDWKDYHFIIPKLAPYFLDTMEITLVENDRELVEGVDWYATFYFSDASRATANRIYGGITILDKTLTGEIKLSYQTIGGEWVLNEERIAQLLTQVQTNPRVTTWEMVVNPPDRFPVIDHEWDVLNMVGMEKVVDAVKGVAETIEDRATPTSLLNVHKTDVSNPHQVTKTQIGLSNVENYPPAEEGDAKTGLRDDMVMTPKTTKSAIDRFAMTNKNDYYTAEQVDNIIANLQNQIDALKNN